MPLEDAHFCKRILYEELFSSHTRIWDWLILIPNLVFMILLIMKFKSTRSKLSTNSSPIIVTFYALVIICVLMSVLRCIISMSVNALSSPSGEIADKVFWVAVRFFFLSMEISVLVFGLAFGHLDSHTSIRRVLLVTTLTSLTYSIVQGTLEIIAPDEKFYFRDEHLTPSEFKLYSHGGMSFWAVTCILFFVVYAGVTILPFTEIRRRIPLPAKKSFYVYTGILAGLNFVQGIGSIVYKKDYDGGLCLIDLTTFLYFSFFHILVYWTFLSTFFSLNPTSLLFSYKHQMDDLVVEDQLEESEVPVAGNAESNIGVTGGPQRGPYLEFSGETSILSLKTDEVSDMTTINSSVFASPTRNLRNGNVISRNADDTDDDDDTLVSSVVSESDSYATARADLSTDTSFNSSRNHSYNQLV